MKQLKFMVRRNLKKAPLITVISNKDNKVYGSFLADDPYSFEGLEKMTISEKIEAKHFMNNLNAIQRHFGSKSLEEQTDYRVRLPESFSRAIDEISLLCEKHDISLDIFESLITSVIQTLKVATVQLPDDDKIQALKILDSCGLSEYKKLDYTNAVQTVFSELIPIENNTLKLNILTHDYFNKNKRYTKKNIEAMASGEIKPSKWLVACAIILLFRERPNMIHASLNNTELFALLMKPLIDHDKIAVLEKLVAEFKREDLKTNIEDYITKNNSL